MKQVDFIKFFFKLFLLFVWIWADTLIHENDNIGGDLMKEEIIFVIELFFHLSSNDILSPASWSCFAQEVPQASLTARSRF